MALDVARTPLALAACLAVLLYLLAGGAPRCDCPAAAPCPLAVSVATAPAEVTPPPPPPPPPAPPPRPSVGFFLKFYETKTETVSNWLSLIDQAAAANVPVYIWIESKKDFATMDLPRTDYVRYITHANKHHFNANITSLEKRVHAFWVASGMDSHAPHCQAHVKSFFLTKEDYIVHIDGDDMYYEPGLVLEDILSVVDHMEANGIDAMSRPYWIAVGEGWSFGFVIQRRSLLGKTYVLDGPENLPAQYRGEGLVQTRKSLDKSWIKVGNLDLFFGAILIQRLRWGYRDLFFHFARHPYWSNSQNPAQTWINTNRTRIFCEQYGIKAFPLEGAAAR